MPSYCDTAPATNSFAPGRDGAVPVAVAHGGGRVWGPAVWPHPSLESSFLLGPSLPCPCLLSSRPAARVCPLLFLLVRQPRFVCAFPMQMVFPRDACVPILSCVAPGSHLGRAQQPPRVQGCGCVGTWGREGTWGQEGWGAVGQPHSSPHSRMLLAGLVTTTLVLCTLSEPSLSGAAWGAVGRGLSTGWTLPSPPLPAGSDLCLLVHPSAQPGKIPPCQGRCHATMTFTA